MYSAGLGIPFLLTGMMTQYMLRAFDSVKRYMWAVEVSGGVLLIAMGLLMVTDNFLVLNRYLDFLNRFAI